MDDRRGSLVGLPKSRQDRPADSRDPKPLGHPSIRSADGGPPDRDRRGAASEPDDARLRVPRRDRRVDGPRLRGRSRGSGHEEHRTQAPRGLPQPDDRGARRRPLECGRSTESRDRRIRARGETRPEGRGRHHRLGVRQDADEYASVAAKMASYGVQAIELNLSCPHVKGAGTEIAQDAGAVRDFTRAVKGAVSVPVFPKRSPIVQDIASFAVAAEEGGADGIVAINTVKAMVIVPELKMPFLANKFGGLSGPAIR